MKDYDVVIIGVGLAGLYCALSMSEQLRIALISNASIEKSNSYLAQGGVAAPVGEDDSPELHYEDTITCGHFLGNKEAIMTLTHEAKKEIRRLETFGVKFDLKSDGTYLLGMEGAHHMPRILRVGDYTGKAIMETLWKRILEKRNIEIVDEALVYEVDSYKKGFIVKSLCHETVISLISNEVVFATGGISRLFKRTSNNSGLEGLGLAPAIKLGVETSHLNWIQFHPTVFHQMKENSIGNEHHGGDKKESFLISEAVRGEGAFLLNEKLERFMLDYHVKGELAPRDVVSKAIINELSRQKNPFVWLDVRHIGSKMMKERFPTISRFCEDQGLVLDRDLIPVSPGAHYTMGGLNVNLEGETNIDGIYAIGECAHTGVHGKNRLASNSLLEALVFSSKAASKINQKYEDENLTGGRILIPDMKDETSLKIPHHQFDLEELNHWMDEHFGVKKDDEFIVTMLQRVKHMLQFPVDYVEINTIDIVKNNMLIILEKMLSQELQDEKL